MKRASPPHRAQRGAALLTAMLTVTLVATFAASALWQQWRAAEVEAAERSRTQSSWVLIGALDWSRLILREDARANSVNGGSDHLAEPWAVPLEEAKLSSFLSADKNVASDALDGLPDAFMSGRIIDAQSKLNVANLVSGGAPDKVSVAAFGKLFELFGLPAQELTTLVTSLQRATAGLAPTAATATTTTTTTTTTGASSTTNSATSAIATTTGTVDPSVTAAATSSDGSGGNIPLMPQRTSQLTWLGLSPSTVSALEPYVTVLPVRTPLNLNTATAEAIYASVPTLDLAGAKRIVAQRTRSYFRSTADASKLVQDSGAQFNEGSFSVATSYFEVHGRLRLDRTWVDEQSLLRRDGLNVGIVWRERGAGATAQPIKP